MDTEYRVVGLQGFPEFKIQARRTMNSHGDWGPWQDYVDFAGISAIAAVYPTKGSAYAQIDELVLRASEQERRRHARWIEVSRTEED